MAWSAEITRHDDFDPGGVEWVGERQTLTPIALVEPDPAWTTWFAELAARIRRSLGGRVLELDHIGSTSVADLPAKPIIDIDLTVADSSDEAAYVPALEREGFVLQVREPGWHGHRLLVAAAPPANLHVWNPEIASRLVV